jgi:ketosteroid isomerase-like protein
MQTSTPPPASLPRSVLDYFVHESTDSEALAECFTTDAVVVDEHREHHGRAAIAAWNAEARAATGFRSEPLGARTEGDSVLVMARVTGSFKGSPVELRFHFTLAGALIRRLEVAP